MHYDDSLAAMVIRMAGVTTQHLGTLYECYNTVKFVRKLGGRSRVSPVHYRRSHSRRSVERTGEQTSTCGTIKCRT